MKSKTVDVVMSVLMMDESVTEEKRVKIAEVLNGNEATTPIATNQLLKVGEVGKILGISRRQVWRYAKRGMLFPVKLSRKVTRFRSSDVMRLMASSQSVIGNAA